MALGRRARDLARGAERHGAADRPADTDAAPAADALSEALTDLTSGDAASLVEALDDLGDPAGYSATGYARLSALASEPR